jgi:hypothetical protein
MLRIKSITLVFLLMSLAGCANFDAVGKFADGAQMLSQASGEFYDSELTTDRKLAGLLVDLSGPIQPGQSAWLETSAGKSLIAEARRNKAAVAALGQYAISLKEIAAFDNDKAVEQSSERLSSNLAGLAKTLDSSANPDESALAQAITSLANIYTGIKVKKVVHKKAQQAQPYVEQIINTLVADIKRQQQRFTLTRLNASAKREQMFNTFKQDYNSAGLLGSQKSLLDSAASKLVEDELAEQLAELPAQEFLAQLNNTADSCLAAHKAIQDADIKDDAKELIAFVDDARKLVSSVSKLH